MAVRHDGIVVLPAATDPASCRQHFAAFAASTATWAPTYSRLSGIVAADPELAGHLLLAPPTQRLPVLLFACVHHLLLDEPEHPLAAWYPNLVVGTPRTDDPAPALRQLCAERRDELAALLATRRTQTNEVGRSALFVPVFGLLADEVGPLAHLDVGTSAGLTLLLDRFHYTYEPGGTLGTPGPIRLTCGTQGAVPIPTEMPDAAAHVGLDEAPIDVGDDDAVRWLQACVWPDQADRFHRLRAAVDLARNVGVDVRRGDAVTTTPHLVDELAAVGHPVLTSSFVLTYLTSGARRAFLAVLDDLAAERDLTWVFVEIPAAVPELPVLDAASDQTALVIVRWRSGQRRAQHLAEVHPHGYWIHWNRQEIARQGGAGLV